MTLLPFGWRVIVVDPPAASAHLGNLQLPAGARVERLKRGVVVVPPTIDPEDGHLSPTYRPPRRGDVIYYEPEAAGIYVIGDRYVVPFEAILAVEREEEEE